MSAEKVHRSKAPPAQLQRTSLFAQEMELRFSTWLILKNMISQEPLGVRPFQDHLIFIKANSAAILKKRVCGSNMTGLVKTPQSPIEVQLNFTNQRSWAIEFNSPPLLIFQPHEIRSNLTKNISLSSVVIGIQNIQIQSKLTSDPEGTLKTQDETIQRSSKKYFVNQLVQLLDSSANFVFMPLLSYGVGCVMFDDKLFRFGLFILGTCPGGTGSNFWCILLGGDLNLSITMTFISTLAAMGMMPFWVAMLGPYLVEGTISIPYQKIIITLLSLIIPVVIGMLIRYKSKRAGQIMAKVIVPFTIILVSFIFTFGTWMNWFYISTFYRTFAGFAWLFRLKLPQIIAVSIETTFQNAGIAFVLLKISLEEPYGDLASVAPIAQLMLTGAPLWLVLLCKKIYDKCCKKEEAEHERVPVEDPHNEKGKHDQSIIFKPSNKGTSPA
ncbi:SLC10A3_5 [Lepeophtheirus salmonis]|uniref:SLC10A3_5 n=1 Tax=Lepeophtheirus salmonis TaxID=72036 RepID=A0A7R8CFN9_LEPSM|nr:SLC10A3_5 [Lepeophtheirus salmonis]CAF2808251.1 SLC10A3_5 [Lepeophtheirus salmonis]